MQTREREILSILTDLNLSENWIKSFQKEDSNQRQTALTELRCSALNQVHHYQNRLEQIDYLRYLLTNKKWNNREIITEKGKYNYE